MSMHETTENIKKEHSWKYTFIELFKPLVVKFLKYSTNEIFSSKKFFEKLQNGAAQSK